MNAPNTPDETPKQKLWGMSPRHLAVGFAVALIAAVSAGLLVNESRSETKASNDEVINLSRPVSEPEAEVVGQPVALGYETFEGESANTAAFVGKPLVLNFFAEWCAPCLAEMPAFDEVYRENDGAVAFLGVSHLESVEDGQKVIDATKVTYPLGRDPSGFMLSDLGGFALPTTAFVSPSGTVLRVHTGPLSANQLRDIIEDLFP